MKIQVDGRKLRKPLQEACTAYNRASRESREAYKTLSANTNNAYTNELRRQASLRYAAYTAARASIDVLVLLGLVVVDDNNGRANIVRVGGER